MENIVLSNLQIQKQYPNCKLLLDLIQYLEKDLRIQGKVLCRIQVNGLPLTEDDETKFANTKMNEINLIEMQVYDREKVLGETILSLKKFLHNLKNEVQDISILIRDRRMSESRLSFTKLINHIQDLAKALMAIRPHLSENVRTEQFETKWISAEGHMLNTLKEIVQAYEKQDLVLVSDALEYELDNSLDHWLALLSSMS